MGLTYPQCDLEPWEFASLLFQGPAQNCDKYVIGKEQHKDGGTHYHVYLHFPKKLNVKNPRYFDLAVDDPAPQSLLNKYQGDPTMTSLLNRTIYHPNIKRFGGKRADPEIDRWISYCKKEGNWDQHGFLENLFTFKHHEGYRNKKADLQAWERDAKAQQRSTPFPFELPNGTTIAAPEQDEDGKYDKRRHWLIVGPPDVGKSYHFMTEFQGRKAYWRPNNETPYEHGSYRQEQVIVIDDIWPKIQEILDITQVYLVERQVYGKSRYTPNFWAEDQARVIIWLLNEGNRPDYTKPSDKNYQAFISRFHIMEYVDGEWHVDRDPTVDNLDVWNNPH